SVCIISFFFNSFFSHRNLHSFPTRRSSDLIEREEPDVLVCDVRLPDGSGVDFTKEVKTKYPVIEIILLTAYGNIPDGVQAMKNGDRKSTRLNSSHSQISYAVFCLKKKKKKK